jgi:hypothetical protein
MLLQPAIIDAAVSAGVQHFYASEWNSDIAQREIYDMRYFRDKQATRSYLRQKAAATRDFQYTLMVTGIFTEWAVDAFYGFDHDKCTAEIFGDGGDRRIGVTSIPDITKYTVESLRIPFNGQERTIRVQGWTGTLAQLINALEKARDKEYKIKYVGTEAAHAKQEEARINVNDLQEMMYSIKSLLASGFGVADGVRGLDNSIFDIRPEQPEQTFNRVFNS